MKIWAFNKDVVVMAVNNWLGTAVKLSSHVRAGVTFCFAGLHAMFYNDVL